MGRDEYASSSHDPSNYWQRYYLPRVIGAMQPWTTLDSVHRPRGRPMGGAVFILPVGTRRCKDMLKKMMEAGNAASSGSSRP